MEGVWRPSAETGTCESARTRGLVAGPLDRGVASSFCWRDRVLTEPTIAQRERCRILIVVPNVLRDLEGHALVAYYLRARYEHDVEFCLLSQLNERVWAYAPDVLVLDRIDNRMPLVRRAKQIGMKVVLLPTVGFVQEGIATEARRAGGLERGEEVLDLCFTWGSHARDLLLHQTRLSEAQVCAVGAVRFDAYSQPFLSLAESRESMLRGAGITDVGAPLIVWCTSTYHIRTRNLEATVRSAVATGVPEAEIRAQLEDEGTAFRDLADVVTTLAARHPEWKFLIKLHPSELPGPYRELAHTYSNIHLLSETRIRDVLFHCDVLLTHCSTAATEAWMLGKPVLEVALGKYHVPSPREYLEGSHVMTALGEIERLVAEYLGERPLSIPDDQQRARNAFLARVYGSIDGKAGKRCAEEIDRLLALPNHTAACQATIRAAAGVAHAQWRMAAERLPSNRVKRILGLPIEMSLRFWERQFWMRLLRRQEGPFAWEREITPEMVSDLYALYDGASRAGEDVRADISDSLAV